MRRGSIKKSSMFKVQQDKNVYKKYLDQIENCASARTHPHLFDVTLKLFRVSKRLLKLSIITVSSSQKKTHSIKESIMAAKLMGFHIQHLTT